MENNLCYLNGEIIPYKDCHLHISDLQLQRSYGVFDFFRCRNNKLQWIDDYLNRLFTSLQVSELEVDLSLPEARDIIEDLQERNALENSAFKILVTGGYSETMDAVTGSANVIILNIPWQAPAPAQLETGVNLISSKFQRHLPEIKSLNYFNTLYLRKKAREYNAVDVLFFSDYIAEASRANIFFVKNGNVITPASNILKGITRKYVLGLDSSISAIDIEPAMLYEFDEAFITSTSRDITPVVAIDGKKIGNGQRGPVTRQLQEMFKDSWIL